MNNYLKLKTMSPFTYSYIFLDCDEYLADQLFIKHNVPVKFGKEYCKNNSRYCVIVRRHIVGGANRTFFSVDLPPRLCRTGTCRRLQTE